MGIGREELEEYNEQAVAVSMVLLLCVQINEGNTWVRLVKTTGRV